MNIIFIDNKAINTSRLEKYLYNNFGFYIRSIKRKNIISLIINLKKLKFNVLYLILKLLYGKKENYIVLCKDISTNKKLKELIDKSFNNKVIVTEQNNLYQNDEKYINKYIKEKELKRENIKVLFVIDNYNDDIIQKIEYFIKKYKILDIYMKNKDKKFCEYINILNEQEGSSIDILDKLPKKNYNIVLMFSKEKNLFYNNCFVLDYNNSDLDVESNTYMIYLKNKDILKKYIDELDLDISRYEKTKLGKLCIHTNGLNLDK